MHFLPPSTVVAVGTLFAGGVVELLAVATIFVVAVEDEEDKEDETGGRGREASSTSASTVDALLFFTFDPFFFWIE